MEEIQSSSQPARAQCAPKTNPSVTVNAPFLHDSVYTAPKPAVRPYVMPGATHMQNQYRAQPSNFSEMQRPQNMVFGAQPLHQQNIPEAQKFESAAGFNPEVNAQRFDDGSAIWPNQAPMNVIPGQKVYLVDNRMPEVVRGTQKQMPLMRVYDERTGQYIPAIYYQGINHAVLDPNLKYKYSQGQVGIPYVPSTVQPPPYYTPKLFPKPINPAVPPNHNPMMIPPQNIHVGPKNPQYMYKVGQPALGSPYMPQSNQFISTSDYIYAVNFPASQQLDFNSVHNILHINFKMLSVLLDPRIKAELPPNIVADYMKIIRKNLSYLLSVVQNYITVDLSVVESIFNPQGLDPLAPT